MSTTNILKRKIENVLKNQVEARISFQLLDIYGINKLGPILYSKNIIELEELFGTDKRFYLENEVAVLVVKYKHDCIFDD